MKLFREEGVGALATRIHGELRIVKCGHEDHFDIGETAFDGTYQLKTRGQPRVAAQVAVKQQDAWQALPMRGLFQSDMKVLPRREATHRSEEHMSELQSPMYLV